MMAIREEDLARWTQQLLCAFLTTERHMEMQDKDGKRPYFIPAMKEEVLQSAIKANRNMANDATKMFGHTKANP